MSSLNLISGNMYLEIKLPVMEYCLSIVSISIHVKVPFGYL